MSVCDVDVEVMVWVSVGGRRMRCWLLRNAWNLGVFDWWGSEKEPLGGWVVFGMSWLMEGV